MRDSEKPFFPLPDGEVYTTGPMGRTCASEDFRTHSNLIDAHSIYTPDRTPQLSSASGDWQGHDTVGLQGWGGGSYGDVTGASPREDAYMIGPIHSPGRRKR